MIAGYYGPIIHHISITPAHEQADVLGTHNAAFWHYKYHKAYNPATLLGSQGGAGRHFTDSPIECIDLGSAGRGLPGQLHDGHQSIFHYQLWYGMCAEGH